MINRTLIKYLFVCSDPKIAREFNFSYSKRQEIQEFARELYPDADVQMEEPLPSSEDGWEIGEDYCPALESRFRKRMRFIYNVNN